jgi:hypothetical protein
MKNPDLPVFVILYTVEFKKKNEMWKRVENLKSTQGYFHEHYKLGRSTVIYFACKTLPDLSHLEQFHSKQGHVWN